MNKQKREQLKKAKILLTNATEIVSAVLDDERDCLDNMPDNLMYSDRYEAMETAVDRLEVAVSSMEEANECLDEAAG